MFRVQIKAKNSARTCEAEKHALRRANSAFVNNMKYTFHDNKSLFLVLDVCTGTLTFVSSVVWGAFVDSILLVAFVLCRVRKLHNTENGEMDAEARRWS